MKRLTVRNLCLEVYLPDTETKDMETQIEMAVDDINQTMNRALVDLEASIYLPPPEVKLEYEVECISCECGNSECD